MTFTVTKEDICNRIAGSRQSCPVALALKRKFKHQNIEV